MLWHTTGAAWLTAFAAIPIMFFVAGSLTGASSRRYPGLLWARLRRLLVPLWVYAAVVGLVGAVQSHADGSPFELYPRAFLRALSWVVPVFDPSSASWHGGWLSSHLWYLRAYVWLLVLTPLFVVALRRRWHGGLAAGAAIGVLVVEATRWVAVPGIGAGSARVVVGDTLAYGLFFGMGMAYPHARQRRAATYALASVLFAAGAGAYVAVAGTPGAGLNGSFLVVVLTGLAWLCALAAVETPLRAIAMRPTVARSTAAVGRRALTIYLWHPAAVVVAKAVVDGGGAATIVLAVALTAAITAVMGPVEDVAAARRPLRPLLAARVAVSGAAVVVVVAVALPAVAEVRVGPDPLDDAAVVEVPPAAAPPSYRAALTNEQFALAPDAHDGPVSLGRLPARQLQRALERWRRANPDVEAVGVVAIADGKEWSGSAAVVGVPRVDVGERYATLSITKLVTAVLALRAADQGLLDLDAPVPSVPRMRVPRAASGVTPRQLIQHASGLEDYRSVPATGRGVPLTPLDAVQVAVRAPLRFTPGSEVHYSSTNSLYLGLVLEQVTGSSYPDLVRDLAGELGPSLEVGPDPAPTWIGFSAGGLYASQRDLAQWFRAVAEPGRVLSRPRLAEMLTIGAHNLGTGTWPLCPCWTDPAGTRQASAMGQSVGNGGLYIDRAGVVWSIRLEPATARSGKHTEVLHELLLEVLRRG